MRLIHAPISTGIGLSRSTARVTEVANTCSMPEAAPLPELDPIVHGQLRLAVLSLLAGVVQADFKWLRGKTGATDGNLGANLAKLEEARYIAVTRKFIGKKPASIYKMTPVGRKALAGYIQALRELLGKSL